MGGRDNGERREEEWSREGRGGGRKGEGEGGVGGVGGG